MANKKLGGDRAEYIRDRLKNQRPDLYQMVQAGELSVHGAAIAAGWRKRKLTVPVDTPEAAVAYLLREFSKAELLRALTGGSK